MGFFQTTEVGDVMGFICLFFVILSQMIIRKGGKGHPVEA